jgi:hypothetical protein
METSAHRQAENYRFAAIFVAIACGDALDPHLVACVDPGYRMGGPGATCVRHHKESAGQMQVKIAHASRLSTIRRGASLK